MSILAKCLTITRVHEGVKYATYPDTKGLLTWGIGWCIQKRQASEEERKAIAQMIGLGVGDIPFDYPVALGRWLDAQSQMHKIEIAHYMHSNAIKTLIPQIETRLGYWPDMNDAQQVGIVDLCYNMGIDRWINLFPKTNMLLAQGKYEEASVELLDSDYHRDLVALRPHPGFVLRSERISRMIATGEWPNDISEPKE